MTTNKPYWLPNERMLIEMVKKNSNIYNKNNNMSSKEYHKVLLPTWQKIANELQTNHNRLMCDWANMYFRYAQIKCLLRENILTEPILRQHPKTHKYLDGTLNFLDPFIVHMKGVQLSDVFDDWNSTEKRKDEESISLVSKCNVTRDMIQAAIKEKERTDDGNLEGIDLEYIAKLVRDSVLRHLIKNNDKITIEAVESNDVQKHIQPTVKLPLQKQQQATTNINMLSNSNNKSLNLPMELNKMNAPVLPVSSEGNGQTPRLVPSSAAMEGVQTILTQPVREPNAMPSSEPSSTALPRQSVVMSGVNGINQGYLTIQPLPTNPCHSLAAIRPMAPNTRTIVKDLKNKKVYNVQRYFSDLNTFVKKYLSDEEQKRLRHGIDNLIKQILEDRPIS